MSTTIFLLLFFAFLIAVLNFLPVASPLSASFTSSLTLVIGYMKAWDFLFPITELMICVGLVMAYELAFWGWKGIVQVTRLIRGTTH